MNVITSDRFNLVEVSVSVVRHAFLAIMEITENSAVTEGLREAARGDTGVERNRGERYLAAWRAWPIVCQRRS